MFNRIASTYGTPTYIYFEESIVNSWNALSAALEGTNHSIHFAVKANSNLSILKLFNSLGAGFDVVSEGELRRVIVSGGKTSEVVFSGVGKTDSEIKFALSSKVKTINVESASELRRANSIAASLGIKAPVLLRLNPNIEAGGHAHISTGTYDSKFGIPIDDLGDVLTLALGYQNIEILGVACHVGSEVAEIAIHEKTYKALLSAAGKLVDRGFNVRYVDFGGGLHVPYSGKYPPLDLKAYGNMVSNVTKDSPYQFIFEPGKFLVAEAGVLLTRVLVKKESGPKKFIVVDAGLSELIRPALYGAFHKVEPISNLDRQIETVDIVGPICESACFIGKEREIPEVKEGELLIVKDTGAYGFSMSSNYNSRPRAAEVLACRDGGIVEIRKRESYENLFGSECEC